jgi:CubicO group peptidase (beta-lactamase class C family)
MKKLLVVLFLVTSAFAQERIEKSLSPTVLIEGGPQWTVEERMRFYKIPGLSVAVVDNGKLVWAKGYGHANIRAQKPVTTKTMFLAGSVSKPVAAMAAVDLVERGKVAFDADVNTILKTWQLPSNDFTAKTPVTLRQLLSHSAGTTVHGFPGYPRAFERPSVKQILDGATPANTAAVRVDLAPNTQFRYSGGGTTIAQQAMADATGLDFASVMRRHVLGPLGMTNSTYAQPLPKSFHGQAATAYRTLDRAIPGGWHVYPEAAAAGLWTTPSDLAKVIVEMHDALAGRDSEVLSIDGARLMLTPRFSAGGPNRHIGVGWFLDQRTSGAKYFMHNGVDEGFDALLIATADGSKGAVMMANTNGSFPLMEEFVRAIAREYNWPGYLTIAPPPAQMPAELLTRVRGRWRVDANRVIPIRTSGEALELVTLAGPVKLHYLSDGTFARHDADERYRVTDKGLEVIAGGKTTLAMRTEDPLLPLELLADHRVDEAIAALRMLNNSQTTARMGLNLLRLGRERDAIRVLELNVELNPQSAEAWDNLSNALLQAGEYERAAEATKKILEYVETDRNLDERARGFLRSYPKIRLHEIENREER